MAGIGGGGVAPGTCGLPQRAQVAALAGFIPPHDAQRVYRTVPCSFVSAVMFYAHLDFHRLYSPAALIQMGLV